MKIVPLENSLEKMFWNHLSTNILNYFFFALDWKYRRDSTRILLALEEDKISGMMLVYRNYIVQLRGSEEAVKELLKYLDLKEVELQAQPEHEFEVLKKYRPNVMHKMILMHLRRGEEKFQAKYLVTELGLEDADKIAYLMRNSNPEFWGNVSAQQISDGIRRGLNWIGIKVDGNLVSIGSALYTEWAGLIGTVATHEGYRNRGYATTVVSELVKRIVEKDLDAIIFVLEENLPAIKVYEKNGFRPYRRYLFIRGSRI